MSTLTYCTGLSTPVDCLNTLGYSPVELFLFSFAEVYRKAAIDTVNYLLSNTEFNQGRWNSLLQQRYGINKRHANGVISFAKGKVDSTKECRQLHIKTLQGKLKSIESWVSRSSKKIKLAQKFYTKKKWQDSKTGCCLPLSSYLDTKTTNWQSVKFQIHQKKRRIYLLKKRLEHLKTKPLQVKVPQAQIFLVGSKDETLGNQICQWDGTSLKLRVPSCLETKFGSYITTDIGDFDRKINRLLLDGAKTWHFYRKDNKWNVNVQFSPTSIKKVSRHSAYGCLGIDMNPGSIGWAYVDIDGNLKHHGQIPLQMGLPKSKQEAQIVDACLQLAAVANTLKSPVVCEKLDFSQKKEQLREKGKKSARMLSGWAYSKFYDLLYRILNNRGIYLLKVNPAFTSVIGLVKYARQYGLASDEAAAIAIARRGMKKSEKLPTALTAYLKVNDRKHVWHWWGQLNTFLKESSIRSRHDYYAISNWESLVKQKNETCSCSSSKRKH